MTKTEFEVRYATNSGMSVERLYELGLSAYPCDCEYQGCNGWQIVHKDSSLLDSEHPNNPTRIEEETMTKEEVMEVLGEPPSSRSIFSDRDRKTTRCGTPESTSKNT